MSASNLLKSDGKIANQYLPNPYPFPASAGLGEVLQVNNSALTPIGAIPQDATDFNTLGCIKIETGTVGQGNNLALVIGEAGDTLQIKGATTKGSLLVGNGANTEEFAVPAPPPPNGSVLILDSTQPLGVRWGGESGPISTITAGNNIDILGTSANPIVAFQTPTTANIRLGVGTELEAKDNYITPTLTMSIDSTGLNDKYDVGGVVNQEDIAVSSTSVIQTLSTTDTSNFQNSAILTCGNGGSGITDSKSSIDLISGASASTTEIIDFNLQNKQEQYLVAPSANTTSYIKSNCELDFTSVPNAYFQLNTNNPTSVNSGFGAGATSTQAEMSSLYENTTAGAESQNIGNIICNGGGSTMTLTSANIAGASSQLLRLECGLIGDALIEHTAVGSARNLDITSTGRIDLQSTNLISDANKLEIRSTNVGGITNPLLVLRNTNNTAGGATFETYKNDLPTSTGGDPVGIWTASCNTDIGKTEITRISAVANGVGAGNNDGSIVLACKVNSSLAPQNFLSCNGGATPAGEIQAFKPINVVGNSIRTSQGDITLDGTASTSGNIILTPKVLGGFVSSGGSIFIPSSSNILGIGTSGSTNTQIGNSNVLITDGGNNKTINIDNQALGDPNENRLTFQKINATDVYESFIINNITQQLLQLIHTDNNVSGNKSLTIDNLTGNGGPSTIIHQNTLDAFPLIIESANTPLTLKGTNVEIQPNNTTGDLIFTGTNIQSATASGNSGSHLRIKLNGTYYKIKLEND
jgi:hypothetical protein